MNEAYMLVLRRMGVSWHRDFLADRQRIVQAVPETLFLDALVSLVQWRVTLRHRHDDRSACRGYDPVLASTARRTSPSSTEP